MIPFNRPYMTGRELDFISEAHARGHLAGDGAFTKRCHSWLEENTGANKALLTHSCTAALEMAALLLDLKAGDEVIMPSYTFVSTANAFVLRGAIPVFVDIRQDTLNIDETLIEQAITERTRAICVVHYAGVACEMDTILELARRHSLSVVEDAAQAVMSTYNGKPLGALGDLGALSFHETKNIISGEGGALLCRDPKFTEQAEIIRAQHAACQHALLRAAQFVLGDGGLRWLNPPDVHSHLWPTALVYGGDAALIDLLAQLQTILDSNGRAESAGRPQG